MLNKTEHRVVLDFLNHKRLEGCERDYIIFCKSQILKFIDFCHANNRELKGVDLRFCKHYQSYLYSLKLKPITVNGRISIIRVFYNFLVLSEEVQLNHFIFLSSMKVAPTVPHYIPIAELKKIFHNIDNGMFSPHLDMAVFECLYGTGMKGVELINLRPNDFKKETESLMVKDKRTRKTREVPLPAGSVYVLKHYVTYRNLRFPLSKYLLVSNRGNQLRKELVRRIIKGFLSSTSSKGKATKAIKNSYRKHLLKAGAKIENVAGLIGSGSKALISYDDNENISRLKLIHERFHPRA